MGWINVTAADRTTLLDAADALQVYAAELRRGHLVPGSKEIDDPEIRAEHASLVRMVKQLRSLAANARNAA
jgi:hypothetical protein